jgi:hypothetical protein
LAKFDMNSYARRGAEMRVAELNDELESIFSAFPDLRARRDARRGAGRPQAGATVGAGGGAKGEERRGMSPAQRKAVSARMKRYWADRRKGKEK